MGGGAGALREGREGLTVCLYLSVIIRRIVTI